MLFFLSIFKQQTPGFAILIPILASASVILFAAVFLPMEAAFSIWETLRKTPIRFLSAAEGSIRYSLMMISLNMLMIEFAFKTLNSTYFSEGQVLLVPASLEFIIQYKL